MTKLKYEERKINLFDAGIEVLTHWRSILIVSVAGLLLAGVYSFWSSYQLYNTNVKLLAEEQAAQQLVEQEIDKAEEVDESVGAGDFEETEPALLDPSEITESVLWNRLSADERRDVMKAIRYDILTGKQETYLELVKSNEFDPSNIPSVDLLFQVVAADIQTSERIAKYYRESLLCNEFFSTLSENTGLDTRLLMEFVSICSAEDNNDSDLVKMTFYGFDREMAESINSAVLSYLTSYQEKMQGMNSGYYYVSIITNTFAYVIDHELYDRIIAIKQSYLENYYEYNSIRYNFSLAQWDYFSYFWDGTIKDHALINPDYQKKQSTEDESENGEEDETEKQDIILVKPNVNVKLCILAFFGMGLLTALLWLVAYIFNGSLKYSDSFEDICGISQLGILVKSSSKKNRFDRWVDDLRIKKYSEANQKDSILGTTDLFTKKNNYNNICVLSSCTEDTLGIDIEELFKDVDGCGFVYNILEQSMQMRNLTEYDAVILTEKIGYTKYADLEKLLLILESGSLPVLGGILVG